jgi:hypothetical protein
VKIKILKNIPNPHTKHPVLKAGQIIEAQKPERFQYAKSVKLSFYCPEVGYVGLFEDEFQIVQ